MTARDLADRLPAIVTLRHWAQSMAMLDAILSPEWQYRYFSFNAAWAEDVQLGSMRDGSGDEYSLLFVPEGAYVRGFAHESAMSPWCANPPSLWPGLVDGVPSAFRRFVEDPAFSVHGVPSMSLCIWREAHDDQWSTGPWVPPEGEPDPDGADILFDVLDGEPETYAAWATNYYEPPVLVGDVRPLFEHQPLTGPMVTALNENVSLEVAQREAAEIGYPT